MIWQVYSVFDTKVGAYAPPFLLQTRGAAMRSFSDAVGDEKLPFKNHPQDYVLYLLGTFDDNDGTYNGSGRPERIIGADEIA